MNPLKVIIVKPEDPNAFSEGVQIVGGIVWAIILWVFWSGANLFDSTAGRICFIPALLIAGLIGYATTLFVIGMSLIITIFGLIIGWVFDFPFFSTMLKYINIIFKFLFN